MKALLLFLALTAPMLAQDTTLRIELPPDTSNAFSARVYSREEARMLIDSLGRIIGMQYRCKVNLITPAGRFMRAESELRTSGPIERDSVLTTGCPVCGSDSVVCRFVPEQIFTATPARIVWDFVEVGSSGAGYDTSRYVPAVPERVIPAHHLCGEVIGWGETRYVCASCGTVYHGRRK